MIKTRQTLFFIVTKVLGFFTFFAKENLSFIKLRILYWVKFDGMQIVLNI